MASGTLGAAMEAALLNKKALALSFAFYNHDISSDKVNNACNVACTVIEKLWRSDAWSATNAGVFNVNVPIANHPSPDVFMTTMGRSHFGSLYRKVGDCQHKAKGINPITGLPLSKETDEKVSKHLRIAVDDGQNAVNSKKSAGEDFTQDGEDGAVYVFSASVGVDNEAGEGTDIWAVRKRAVSITPLRPELGSLGNADQQALWNELGFTSLVE
ncbi:hypothetical protein H4R99_003282 [Coemansia sp. RSA 1722]|nr:hypothetical protein LPJ57_006204 [Coemansia sp. RSA 486]KAJ2236927.1 hypothetical protein IWW45_001384 [Coemansia sp. RSA 485]KAJ2600589.1 hypothetical protein H4R99_003282 [Coemansia sp. RSA 1722]KAJ2639461.1 hypothetical protein GGF40_000819 [Coemansia sp. RSA 1286]